MERKFLCDYFIEPWQDNANYNMFRRHLFFTLTDIVFYIEVALQITSGFPGVATHHIIVVKNTLSLEKQNSKSCLSCLVCMNPFHATGLFRYPWKHQKTLRGCRKRPVAWNGLISWIMPKVAKGSCSVKKIFQWLTELWDEVFLCC